MKRSLLFLLLTLCVTLVLALTASGTESECPLEQLPGASVRLDENHSGLRFESRIPTDALAELGDVTVGTLIFPTDQLTGELTVETTGALNLVGARPIEKNDGYTYFYAAIVDILPQNYTRDFTAVSYVKSGESYSYTAESTSASIYGVSKAAYASKYADNAIVRGYLDRVLVLDRASMTVIPHCPSYVSPYEVTYANGKITVTPKDGRIEEKDIATFLIDGVAYTGGWSKSGETLVAPFCNEFTVTFSVQGESTSETYAYGETPAYTGLTDFKASDNLNYRIVGWDKAFAPVTGDVTYTAETLRRYELRWKDKTGYVERVYNCLEGEIPVPPETITDDILTASTISRFTGWDRELTALPSDYSKNFILYTAQYVEEARKYPVHFRINGEVIATVDTPYGSDAVYPSDSYGGVKIAYWLNAEGIEGETVCDAVCSPFEAATLKWAYESNVMKYVGTYENDGNVSTLSSAMLYLILSEYEQPSSGLVRDRALLHLRSMITGGSEPGFNSGPFWSYASVSLSITLARYTPTIWNEFTEDEKDRFSLLMECYAILACLVTDDDNNYRTGPALTGNFVKTWNPNHRLAMFLPIVSSTVYFSADGKDGAAYVNGILTGFDHDAYIARFTEYGFTRAIYNWTTEGATFVDGNGNTVVAPGAKELMMNGGQAYISHLDSGSKKAGMEIGDKAGTGVGVRTTYTYGGYGLDDLQAIVDKLYAYNYSGGAVVSDSSRHPNGLDENGKPLAYIADGTKSPFEGELGMMYEFETGDGGGDLRSSSSYCTHDFMLAVQSLAVLSRLDAYEVDLDSALFRKMWVGNGDLMYKNEHGYNSYSMGNDQGTKYDANFKNYLPWKAWWIANYADAYTLKKPIQYLLGGGSLANPVTSYTYDAGAAVTVTLPSPTHAAGDFIGWFLDEDCTVTSMTGVSVNNGVLTLAPGYSEGITLYASYDIPKELFSGNVILHVPSALGVSGAYDGLYFDLGTDFRYELPRLTLPDGYRLVSWHYESDFSDAPSTGDVLVIPKARVALHEDIHLYPRITRVYVEQAPGSLLNATFSTKESSSGVLALTQTFAANGSALIKKNSGSDAYIYVRDFAIKTGCLTIEMTLSRNGTDSCMSTGFRLRPKNGNTSNSVNISSKGVVKVAGGSTEVGTLSATPTRYSFVFREQADGVGYDIDCYVNGVYKCSGQHDIRVGETEVDIADVVLLHFYFKEDTSGALCMSGLRVVDGFDVN